MIQKRYEFFGPKGKKWTDWFTINEKDSDIEKLQKEENWRVKNKLKNEYRVV